MSRLIKRYAEELAAGVTPSLPEFKTPFFVSSRNVRFSQAGVEPLEPAILAMTRVKSEPVRGMIAGDIKDKPWLFWGSANGLFKWNGEDPTATLALSEALVDGVLDGTEGKVPTVWTMVLLGNVVLASDGVRPIYESVNAADFVQLEGTDIPVFASVISAFQGHPIALGTDEGLNVIQWADRNDYTDWAPTAANSAGSLPMEDAAGPIRAGAPLGNIGFLIYTLGSIHSLFDAGSARVFGTRRVIPGIGAASKHAVVPVGNQHYVFDTGGIYVTDGVGYQFIDDPQIRRYIQDQFDKTRRHEVVGFFHAPRDEIQWYFPTSKVQGIACVSYRRVNKSWAINTAEITSGLTIGAFPYTYIGDSAGDIYRFDPDFPGTGTGNLHLKTSGKMLTGCGVEGVGRVGFGGKTLNG